MRVRGALDNIRLRNKMLIIYFLSVLVPVILTNVIFYNITTNNVKKQKMDDLSLAIEQMRNEFLYQIDVVVGISTVLYNDSILNEYLDQQYDIPSDYVMNYHSYITDMLEKYAPVYRAIQNISLFTDNNTIIYGGSVLAISDIEKEDWYKRLESSRTSNPIIVRDTNSTTQPSISIVRKMSSAVGQTHYEKVIKIDLHPELIKQMFSNVMFEGNVILLADDEVQYESSPNENKEQGDKAHHAAEDGAIVLEENFPSVEYLEGWRISGEFQEWKVLEDVRKSREFVIYMALPNVLVPTLIIIWFTRSLNVRLIRILKHMKRVKNHSFETIDNEETKDEIGQLTTEFNRMTSQISSLIHDVYKADIQKKELELKRNQTQLHALQSQINPHFLFNSLETIRMRSLMKSEEETAKIIHHMAKIFRKSLSWGKDLVTVKDELELVESFLQIQKYRFGDKLNYRIEADDASLLELIPKMTLQPLVENASIHGIEPLKQGGKIDIHIERLEDKLIFTIMDNGIGMDEERVKLIYSYLESEEVIGERIGVQNVIYRLKLIYGDRFRLQIDSSPGQGTSIRLQITVE
ncbi:sensor histidine kinase [Cohnella herbarum]|uniref:Sensor histidine kinase n=1 Tax=Cohnella herbarum TaxID=2728023 RepID=A0A7Z2VQC8_9BACL|nr:sensor histidine kinase [Cohnella herbarum]QJD87372.1 sensor histidine kinase [Cohnella herbarum]